MELFFLEGNLNGDLYEAILEEVFEGEYNELVHNREYLYQHDNAPAHRKCRQYISDVGVEVLDWPSQSPDLSPILRTYGA